MRPTLLSIILSFLLFPLLLSSQCDPITPTFSVNLTGTPSGTWVSPAVVRNGACCDQPARCIKFIITLDPSAAGITFSVASGANPGGALDYEIDCIGPPTPSGGPICLSGGTHTLTFCKVGNNQNTYQITSIPKAVGGTDANINDGCSKQIFATGFNPATVSWSSIFPGTPGAYNSYLSCSTCVSPTVTGTNSSPLYVDYVVCGQPAAQCNFATVCDTVRVNFNPTLGVNIIPLNPTICFGQTSTTLTAIGTGGTPPYSYLWNNVNPSQTINVGVGTYNIMLTDGSGCPPVYNQVTVTAFSVAITANAGANQVKCIQTPLTTLNGTVTGASGGIWSGGTGTFSPNNTTLANLSYSPTAAELATGFVNLILTTTGNGTCPSKQDTVKITYLPFTGVATSSVTNVSCFGGSNGTATVNLTGGITPYTYLWNTSPTQTTSSIGSLPIGTFSVTIRDGIGCTLPTTVVITQPPILAVSATVSNVTCFGTSSGSISSTPVGGTSPYSYSWSPGSQTGAAATGLIAGNYSLTVTDAKGCIKTATYIVTQPLPITIALTPTNVSCFNGSNGAATSTVTGGTSSYTYSWSPGGATSQNVTGLIAGTYTLTVTDALGCIATKTVAITQPTVLIATTTVVNETCNYLNNGSATASQTGGTAGYTYSWSPGGQTSATISGLTSGSYTVVVTDSKGCQSTAVATITEPLPLVVGFINQVNVSCFGGSNGSVGASPSGGTPNYTYSWSPGGSTNASIANLPIGTYTVKVTDNNSCIATNTVLIIQPTDIVTTSTIVNVSCNGGSNGTISLTPSGGVGPYTYLWSAGGQTTSSVTGLPIGTYSVTVTDANGCPKNYSYTIAQPLALAIAFTTTNVSCFNGSNGAATSTVTGGTSSYTYSWSPGGATSQNVTGLIAGTYTLTVTDALGCIVTNTVAITQPTVLIATTTVVNETCNYLNNGSATASQTGGTAGYTYSWSPGGQTSATISGLTSGSYTVVVTDSKGCQSTAVATITEPLPLVVGFINQVNVSCFGGSNGSVGASPSGGTPNYTYSWSPGGSTNASIANLPIGTYTVKVTDNNSCIATNTVLIIQPTDIVTTSTIVNVSCNGGSNGTISLTPSGGVGPYTYLWSAGGQTTSSVTGLPIGTYSVTVTDANGCPKNYSYTIAQPLALAIAFTTTNVSCFNGSNGAATSTVTGGTSSYTYSWSPGGATSQNVTGLIAGTYTLTVTDALGCIVTNTVAITQPTVLIATTTVVNETCNYLNNGSATASQTGGTAGYTYSWSPGGQTSATISGLTSGSYTVVVTDSKGCQSTAVATITEPLPLVVGFINQVNVSCFGGSNGSVGASPSGGTPNYTYSWSPGGSTNASIANLPIGTYTVKVTDNNSCIATNTVLIIQPTDIVTTSTIVNVSCNGGSNGTISLTPSGGVGPYTYLWSAGGQTTSSVTGLPIGTYSVTVTDANGCPKNYSYTIAQPLALAIAFTTTNVSCFNGSNGAATSTVTGGTSSYTYSWSPGGATSQNVTGLIAGTYTLTVTDALGCIVTNTVAITQPTVLIATTTVVNETCNYLNNGSATASQTGGTAGYTYSWSPGGQTSATISGLTSGSYTVVVTDSKGCQSTAVATITEPLPLVVGFINQVNVSCFGGSNASIGASPSGGNPNYTYSWTPGGATANGLFNIPAGTYTVTITDNNSCTVQNTIAITQPTAALSVAVSSQSTTCNGGSNGSATGFASGGTPGYSYSWMPGSVLGQTIPNIPSGTYSVTATDLNGCVKTNTVFVVQPAPILPVTTSTNSTCGNSNGIGSVSVTGGVGPYTYSWMPTGGTNSVTTGVPADVYSVTVKDANNCTATQYLSLDDNSGPNASIFSTTNVSCFGGNNGSATAMIVGGLAPITYTWFPTGGNGTTANGLIAGTYYIVAEDANGCISNAITSPSITEPPPITETIITTSISCFGGSNGTATVVPSGGTPGYTTTWMPSATTGSVVTGLTVGTFSVQIKDANSCIRTTTYSIAQPAASLAANATSTAVSCFGGNNGAVTVNVIGGTAPYNYKWMPGNIVGQTISNLSAGTYTSTVTDINNCTTTATVTVIQPTAIVLTTGSINSNCGAANGQASVSVSGGTPGYSYSWSPSGGTGTNASGLLAGNYTVQVTDANSCVKSATQTVIDNPGPTVTVASTTSVSCFGGNNATATASVTGGTGPFTYTWSPTGGNSQTGTGLTAGIYTVFVTAANGCLANAVSSSIAQPTLLFSSITTSNVSCFAGANGSATVTAGGGTPGYTYTWMPGATTGSVVTSLTVGTFSIQIKDANNCIHTNTYSISQPAAALAASATSSAVSCFGGSNGTATVTTTGGTAPYNYKWMPGNIVGQTISNLTAGTYTATVTDVKNCTTTATVNVIQPTAIVLTTGSINSNCGAANGQASVSASGGTPGYSYSWSPSGGTGTNASGLLAGNYTVQVTDANSCVKSATQTVIDNPGPTVTVASTTSVSCFGGNNATATASVTGGTGPFTYTWSPTGGNSQTGTGLTAGIYTVFVTAANGCLANAVSSSIAQPTLLFSSITTSNVSCFAGANGSATVTAGGGTPGYTYTWMPGATTGSVVTSLTVGTFSIQIKDANNCIHTNTYSISQPAAALAASATSSAVSCFGGSNGTATVTTTGGTAPYNYKWMPGNIVGQTISNLTAGTYTATVTDVKNCTTTATVNVIQPTAIVLTTGSINSNCGAANGQASVSASGGTPGYSYSWSPSGGTGTNASGLLAGNYTVQVTDANSCVKSATQTVIDNPGPTVTVASTTSVSCFGGNNATATASVTGGTGPFTYTWSPTGGNSQTGTGLTAGIYTVFVTAANGCLANAVSSSIAQPTLLFSSITTSNVSCFAGANGSATVTAGGGTPGYTYTWMPGATTGSVVTSLTVGTFSIQIKDANNCIHTNTYSISQPAAALAASATSSAVSCFGGNNGTATVTTTGGTAPYNYNWLPMGVNSSTIGGLSTGTYSVNVVDSKNCTTSTTVFVTQPFQALSAIANSVPTSCSGGSDGTATVTPAGGTSGYTYSWSPSGGTSQTASGLLPGTYIITVGDANGCQTNVSVIVSSPTPVTGSLSPIDAACGLANGSISSQVSGGIGPYTYTWSPVSSNASSITGLLPNTYTLIIADSYNCIKTLTTTLVNIAGPTLSVTSVMHDSCFGGSNGAATINITQGTLPYSTNWSPFGGNSTTATQLTAGTYTATVVDGRGCVASIAAVINEPSPVSISISTIVNVSCFSGSDGSITVIASGGTPSYTYSWSPTGIGQSIDSLAVGSYTVKATDSHFCTSVISINVTQPIVLTSTITNVVNPICFNGTGNTSASVDGGTAPYTYSWTTTPPQNGSVASNIVSGTYTVFVTDNNGCKTSNTVTLTQPTQVLTQAGLNDTICLSLSGAVTASATGGAGGYYYAWQPGGTINAGTLNINPATSTTNYTVVAFDQNGCAGIADTVRAVVYSLTAATIDAIAVSPICKGQGTTIYATATGITGPLNYSWNNGLGSGPGAFVVIPTQPTTYILTVTNSCGASIVDSVRVDFIPPPTMNIASSNTLTCIPTVLNFIDNSTSGSINDPITNWNWNFGDGSSSSAQNPVHIYTTPGTYSVILTVSTTGGCTNNTDLTPIIIYARPYPVASFTVNQTIFNLPYDELICTNLSTGAVSYNWSFGDGGTSTAVHPHYNYTTVGFYDIQLIATSPFGCSDTAVVKIATDADLIFPNAFTPNEDGTNDGYYIPGSLDNDIFFPYASGVVEYKFQVFNRWGELIFETEDFKQGWNGYYRGKICQVGVYVWKAYVKLNNGKIFNLTGDVTLLR
ncbi:MAG: PKD domain-containing protein [Bacteroidota bacterium]